ncbi:zinc ribbon domain-containing protein [Comamonas odontotermitis]|uniref:zinc ribbon domain-containing protein n=1 Tax=Comamonas odontotermitis TaxID=379895 RepID=UPI001CC5B6BD|nr:zinc ribbon domain-containing protein [Comamonas odontotermitis]UBB17405.1 zinc ribbon domain-containing protein [Comamonas odontotermitis]
MGILSRLFQSHGYGGHHGGGHGARPYYTPSGGSAPTASTCPGCRTAVAAGTRFCPQCGQSLVPAACLQCGAGLSAGARFCDQCGKSTAG